MLRHGGLLVSWAAPVVALHLVSGAGQSFSTWNHSSCSESIDPAGAPDDDHPRGELPADPACRLSRRETAPRRANANSRSKASAPTGAPSPTGGPTRWVR